MRSKEQEPSQQSYEHLQGNEPSRNQVNRAAEWRPPEGAGKVLAAVLPQVLQPVPGQTDHKQPWRSGDGHPDAMSTKIAATLLSITMTLGRPSATAKPM